MKLEQSFIDELLARIDIIEIIEQRITLKKTGQANYTGLCPFHQEKTPSFSANQVKQFYYCFGCKASGNAINFLMAYEKLSFLETVQSLASKAGLLLPEKTLGVEEDKTLDSKLLEQAAKFYESQLQRHFPAKQYLEQRGLTAEIIQKFSLGFAPDSWESLVKSLKGGSDLGKQLLELGMLVPKKNQGAYDRFRDRIMFPIRNKRGLVIGFGGRSLGSKMPKYLNSPETSLFHKSRELYGLYEALQVNKTMKRIIIVEGYLDVISLHQFGFSESVATLGTAISMHHIQTLLRFSESLLFCFDGDLAGNAAAWRALEIAFPLMHTGTHINFLFLPNGEDPDSFVRKVGHEKFMEKITEAIPLPDFFFQKLQTQTEIETLAGKTRFVYMVEKYLQKQPQGIFKELMYEKLSKIIGLNLEKIHELLDQPIAPQRKKTIENSRPQSLLPPVKLAISLLLQRPTLLRTLPITADFSSINVAGIDLLKRLITIIRDNSQQTTGSLLEYLNDDSDKELFLDLAAQDLLIPDDTWQDELQGALKRIFEIDLEQKIQRLLTKGKSEGLTAEEKRQLQSLLIKGK